jgi:hypothetical protein
MARYALIVSVLSFGLTPWPAFSTDQQVELLLYRVQSANEGAAFNRLLVSPGFLRLDRGEQDPGYILFDRREGIIYSVNRDEQSILVIDPPELPADFGANAPAIGLQQVTPVEAPEVAGVKPQHWRLMVAEASCREAFVLPGAMPNAVAAYGEYLRVLARQQAQALSAIPTEFQDACDNAVHVFAVDALLSKGLPLDVWSAGDYRESLVDFRESFTVSEDDFILPADYARVPMRTMF